MKFVLQHIFVSVATVFKTDLNLKLAGKINKNFIDLVFVIIDIIIFL